MKRIAFVGSVGAGKTTLFKSILNLSYLMRCRGIIPSPEKHRPWNLMIRAILIRRVNILTIPAGITP